MDKALQPNAYCRLNDEKKNDNKLQTNIREAIE